MNDFQNFWDHDQEIYRKYDDEEFFEKFTFDFTEEK